MALKIHARDLCFVTPYGKWEFLLIFLTYCMEKYEMADTCRMNAK
jgi:hypothetical protein